MFVCGPSIGISACDVKFHRVNTERSCWPLWYIKYDTTEILKHFDIKTYWISQLFFAIVNSFGSHSMFCEISTLSDMLMFLENLKVLNPKNVSFWMSKYSQSSPDILPEVFAPVENHTQSILSPGCFMLLLEEHNSCGPVFLSPSVYPGNTSLLNKFHIGVGDDIYLHQRQISLQLCAF